jgi:nicotinamidase-related amidase
VDRRLAFLDEVDRRLRNLPRVSLSSVVERAGGIERVFLVLVDILKGFCDTGPLSSTRVREMVEPVRRLTAVCIERGLPEQNLLFLHDAHPEYAAQFAAFPPHCVRGTAESEVVDELRPFWELQGVMRFRKNATNGLFGVNDANEVFHAFLTDRFREGHCTFLVMGDCTDLCIYQNALGIRLLANERNADVRVLVSREHVRTYDLPVDAAEAVGALPHDGDVMDQLFTYHMWLNGVEIVQTVRPG